jgi:hypothetical protein
MNEKTVITAILALTMLSMLVVANSSSAQTTTLGSIYINPDGSVTGTDSIKRNGDTYTLTANISDGICILKSFVVFDGAGFAINGDGQKAGVSFATEASNVTAGNVTVKNLKIVNCSYAINIANTANNTFIGNYILKCDTAAFVIGSPNSKFLNNTIRDCGSGISLNYGCNGTVIVNNNFFVNQDGLGLSVWLSAEPFVDRNYWSNYLFKCPDGREINNAGVWNKPYGYEGSFMDYHPLVYPIYFPLDYQNPTPAATPTQSPIQTSPSPSPTIPEFPVWAILMLLAALAASIVLASKRRKDNK